VRAYHCADEDDDDIDDDDDDGGTDHGQKDRMMTGSRCPVDCPRTGRRRWSVEPTTQDT